MDKILVYKKLFEDVLDHIKKENKIAGYKIDDMREKGLVNKAFLYDKKIASDLLKFVFSSSSPELKSFEKENGTNWINLIWLLGGIVKKGDEDPPRLISKKDAHIFEKKYFEKADYLMNFDTQRLTTRKSREFFDKFYQFIVLVSSTENINKEHIIGSWKSVFNCSVSNMKSRMMKDIFLEKFLSHLTRDRIDFEAKKNTILSFLFDCLESDPQVSHYKNCIVEDLVRKKELIDNLRAIPKEPLAIENYLSQLIEVKCMTNDQKLFAESVFEEITQKLLSINFKSLGLDKISYIKYGSISNGFAIGLSDLDTSLLTKTYINERNLLEFVYLQIAKTSEMDKNSWILLNEKDIRVPIIKYTIEPNELNKKAIEVDIAVNNVLGVVNSRLLKTYSLLDERLRKMGILVKLWAKKNKLISTQTLSSYSLVLMVIYFFQIKKLVPSVQKLSKIMNKPSSFLNILRISSNDKKEIFKTRVDFEDDIEFIKNYAKKVREQKGLANENQSLLQLLKEFFLFYSEDGAFQKYHMRVNIKRGDIDFKNQFKEEMKFIFSIKDPIDKLHNPGYRLKTTDRGSIEALALFKSAFKSLLNPTHDVLNELFSI